MRGLTPKQERVLDYVRGRESSPSFREIADGCEIRIGESHAIVAALVERGFVTKLDHRARSIRLAIPPTMLETIPTPHLTRELERRGFTVQFRSVVP